MNCNAPNTIGLLSWWEDECFHDVAENPGWTPGVLSEKSPETLAGMAAWHLFRKLVARGDESHRDLEHTMAVGVVAAGHLHALENVPWLHLIKGAIDREELVDRAGRMVCDALGVVPPNIPDAPENANQKDESPSVWVYGTWQATGVHDVRKVAVPEELVNALRGPNGIDAEAALAAVAIGALSDALDPETCFVARAILPDGATPIMFERPRRVAPKVPAAARRPAGWRCTALFEDAKGEVGYICLLLDPLTHPEQMKPADLYHQVLRDMRVAGICDDGGNRLLAAMVAGPHGWLPALPNGPAVEV